MLYPLGISDSAAMAAIHHKAMERSWDEASFSYFLSDPFSVAYGYRERAHLMAFVLGRQVGEEVEILTLAVDPAYWRQGLGRKILQHFQEQLEAKVIFLEVNEMNQPALALYRSAGFEEDGVRKGYYTTAQGSQDAILMRKFIA